MSLFFIYSLSVLMKSKIHNENENNQYWLSNERFAWSLNNLLISYVLNNLLTYISC